tara:strand:+ start:6343 stop:7605 length:1263 start_codon:yes stop_codon:yes gene_type:complete
MSGSETGAGTVFYQGKSTEPGSIVANVNGVPVGNISLFELNVDRAATSTGRVIGLSSSVGTQNVVDNGTIYPFIEKGLSKVGFKGLTREQFINDYAQGDVITGSYFMSASLTRRKYIASAGFNDANRDGAALKNSLDFAKRLGDHYDFPSGSSGTTTTIDIPSIYYGSGIKPGTVSLEVYVTGTLHTRCRDSRYDGALIQDFVVGSDHGASSTPTNGTVVGCILYKEGVIILNNTTSFLGPSTSVPNTPGTGTESRYSSPDNQSISSTGNNWNWTIFGVGIQNGPNVPKLDTLSNGWQVAKKVYYKINFAGTHKIPTVTMLANANRGELNYTNNPTYIEFGQTAYNPVTSSTFFGEQQLNIKNIHSSSYSDPTGSLKKTTYITKIGIYDDKKKLIGVASVAKPVKKTEDRDLTFKLKLDI